MVDLIHVIVIVFTITIIALAVMLSIILDEKNEEFRALSCTGMQEHMADNPVSDVNFQKFVDSFVNKTVKQ